uniref:Uncharacterized protein n=1 Tax=Mycena chlorophos TaxID=658473 RepID=A0ABQ0L3B7_MYCCL|nr:predicted protein [Mycena chlorophos]
MPLAIQPVLCSQHPDARPPPSERCRQCRRAVPPYLRRRRPPLYLAGLFKPMTRPTFCPAPSLPVLRPSDSILSANSEHRAAQRLEATPWQRCLHRKPRRLLFLSTPPSASPLLLNSTRILTPRQGRAQRRLSRRSSSWTGHARKLVAAAFQFHQTCTAGSFCLPRAALAIPLSNKLIATRGAGTQLPRFQTVRRRGEHQKA